jgi:hypothetical protein
MTEMRRLIDGEVDEHGLELLRSALHDAPRGDSRQRLLVSLGVASGAMTAAAAAEGAGATGAAVKAGAGVSGAFVAKWIGVGVVAAGITTGAAAVVSELASDQAAGVAPSASAARTMPNAAVATQRPEPQPLSATDRPRDEPANAAATGAPRGSGAAMPAAVPGMAAEVRVLDRAREALRAGDSAGAMRALDEHGDRFADGALGEEAELLRIEALLERGALEAAAAGAESFLAAHPKSSHRARVRSLLRRVQSTSVPNSAGFPEEE